MAAATKPKNGKVASEAVNDIAAQAAEEAKVMVDNMFEAANKAGVSAYIVEQDESDGDSIESAAISAEFVRNL